jgi:hypothetical protein
MKFLEKYKSKKCKTWFGKIIQRFVFDKLTKLVFFTLLAITSIVGVYFSQESFIIWDILFLTSIAYLTIFGIILIAYAWIINPINSKKQK